MATLVFSASGARAQKPLNVGTAAGVAGTAVTEARRGDAMLWNPALVGIYDGPRSSYSLFSVDFSRLPSSEWLDAAGGLGLVIPGKRLTGVDFVDAITPGDSRLDGTMGGITIGAFQARDLAVALSSQMAVYAAVPGPLSATIEGRDPVGEDLANSSGRESFRSLSTMFSVTKAAYLNRLPLLGQVWLGATAKGWYLHEYARGSFTAAVEDGGVPVGPEIYSETQIKGVPGYGFDLGIALRPFPGLRIGAAASNVFSGVIRPSSGASVRRLHLENATTAGHLEVKEEGPHPVSNNDVEYQEAGRVWETVNYPALARVGAALDLPFGTFAGSYQDRINAGGLEPEWAYDRYSASVSKPFRLPMRVATSWGDDVRGYEVGVVFGSCDRPITVAAGQRDDGRFGKSYSVSVSATFTDLSCRAPR